MIFLVNIDRIWLDEMFGQISQADQRLGSFRVNGFECTLENTNSVAGREYYAKEGQSKLDTHANDIICGNYYWIICY